MSIDERNGIERSLKRLVPKAAPPGLRERALASALRARQRTALTPPLRVAAVACSILIIALIGLDPLIGRPDMARLRALSGGRASAAAATEEASMLIETLGGEGLPEDFLMRARIMAASAALKGSGREIIEARKGLKEWLKDESF